ncbi:MAG: hypothetical protein AAGF57_13830 [Pseudomonadota bacterium]
MTDVFVVQNQLGHYWGKSKCWVDGSQPRLVLKTTHKDEAVNILFELSSKDFELRGNVVTVQLSERGEPIIEPSQIPLPIDPAIEIETAQALPTEEGGSTPHDGPSPAEASDDGHHQRAIS